MSVLEGGKGSVDRMPERALDLPKVCLVVDLVTHPIADVEAVDDVITQHDLRESGAVGLDARVPLVLLDRRQAALGLVRLERIALGGGGVDGVPLQGGALA